MKFTKEDFEAWQHHHVTEEVFAAFDRLAMQAKESWLAASWKNGHCDPVLLADLRARAEVVEDFRKITFEAIEEWLSDEQPQWNLSD